MKKNNAEILFSILILFSLFLSVIGFFCGGEIMKDRFKIWYFISLVIIVILISGLTICTLVKYFFWQNESKNEITVINKIDQDETELKNATKLIMLKELWDLSKYEKLRTLEIICDNYSIPNDIFPECYSLETLILHYKPQNKKSISFKNCISLKTLVLYGEEKDWIDFKATLPPNCNVRFEPYKKLNIVEVSNNTTNIDVTIKHIKEEKE